MYKKRTLRQLFAITGIAAMIFSFPIAQPVPVAYAATSSIDVDADGYPDCYEQDKHKSDHDNDGKKNADDTDDDNDGIADTSDSKPYDKDNDGTSDQVENGPALTSEQDADADGYLDTVEKDKYKKDHDNDEKKDGDDSDDDNDGTKDSNESDKFKKNHDNDKKHGNGYKDKKDPDDDNDGIKDYAEKSCAKIHDHDNDGTSDKKDTDDDNDGFAETDSEGNATNGDAFPWDHDNDGIKDNKDDDDDNDGIKDSKDSKPFDSDNDGMDDVDEGIDTSARRVYYGYLTSQYNATNNGRLTQETITIEATYLYMGVDDPRLLLISSEASGNAEQTGDDSEEYTVADTNSYTEDEEETQGETYGRIEADGTYYLNFMPTGQNLSADQGNGEIYYWSYAHTSVDNSPAEDCEPDPSDNTLYIPCGDTVDSSTGAIDGTWEDQTNNFQSPGSRIIMEWKLVPTSCTTVEGCTRPDDAIPPQA
jgi:hypothetical protein